MRNLARRPGSLFSALFSVIALSATLGMSACTDEVPADDLGTDDLSVAQDLSKPADLTPPNIDGGQGD